MYVERRCVAALGNNLSTNILRRYAASILIIFRTPWVTAATHASPKAKIPIALRAYLWLHSLSILKYTALGNDPTLG